MDFLSNIKTKAELTTYLAAKATGHSKGPTNTLKKFIVTPGTGTKSSLVLHPPLIHTIKKRGTPHCCCTPFQLTNMQRLSLHQVVIASPDNDVFLLMVQMYPSLPCDICFYTGKRNLKRNIPLQPLYSKLGHRRTSAIPGVYAQPGSGMSGRFAGRIK